MTGQIAGSLRHEPPEQDSELALGARGLGVSLWSYIYMAEKETFTAVRKQRLDVPDLLGG